TGVSALDQSIAESEAKIEALGSSIKELSEKKASTEAALQEPEHTASRAEAKETMSKATALRDTESKAALKFKSESDINISAIAAAVKAIENGMSGSFLQTSSANKLRQYAMEKATMSDTDRQERRPCCPSSPPPATTPPRAARSSASGDGRRNGRRPGGRPEGGGRGAGELRPDDGGQDEGGEHTHRADRGGPMTRLGEVSVMLGEDGNDLEETKDTLAEDTQYLAELKKGCATKEAEWEARCKVRAEESLSRCRRPSRP
ncbi:unnamed protein product, partial [Prorocentrum cordatum]